MITIIKKLRIPLVIVLIFAIASIGFANAAPRPLQIVRLAYATSTEPFDPALGRSQFSWTDLPGNQFPVGHLKLNGNPETWYYLDVTFTKPQIPFVGDGALPIDIYGFFLDPDTYDNNPEFKAYWDAKLNDPANAMWAPIMWQIIDGTLPMFSFSVRADGSMRLHDGLLGILLTMGGDPTTDPGPVRLSGDYPRGTYVFTAGASLTSSATYLEGVTITLMIK